MENDNHEVEPSYKEKLTIMADDLYDETFFSSTLVRFYMESSSRLEEYNLKHTRTVKRGGVELNGTINSGRSE